jgi:hypothetical protein
MPTLLIMLDGGEALMALWCQHGVDRYIPNESCFRARDGRRSKKGLSAFF